MPIADDLAPGPGGTGNNSDQEVVTGYSLPPISESDGWLPGVVYSPTLQCMVAKKIGGLTSELQVGDVGISVCCHKRRRNI